MDRPHLRPSHRFLTRTLPFLAALTVGVAYITAPPMARAEASWKGTGCVTATGFEPGRSYDSIISKGRTPDLNVVSVVFSDGATMDFTTPGPISTRAGDAVEAELSASASYTGEFGQHLAVNKVSDAVNRARTLRKKAMLGVDQYPPYLTARLDVTQSQGCASKS